MTLLDIENIHAEINGTEILKGISLQVNPGEIHAVMGPNGSGKSTLAKLIVGHPAYTVTAGDIRYQGKSILGLTPEERSHAGIFLAFQYPTEIPGVNNANFLRLAYNAKQKALGQEELDPLDFDDLLREKMTLLDMDPSLRDRSVNAGFSGGEKKKNEILQMAILEPTLAVLDETDSGLDIDALRDVAHGVNQLMTPERAVILVTHYQRLLNYIEPTWVHIFSEGRIVKTGPKELALDLEAHGYDALVENASEPAGV